MLSGIDLEVAVPLLCMGQGGKIRYESQAIHNGLKKDSVIDFGFVYHIDSCTGNVRPKLGGVSVQRYFAR